MKNFLLGALLALSSAAGAASAESVSVEIGTRQVAIETPAQTERVSLVSPMLFKIHEAGLASTHRLVEGFITQGDLERTLAGQLPEDVVYQVQAMRRAEDVEISAAAWRQMRPELERQMASVDMSKLIDGLDDGASDRMSEVSGVDVDMKFGKIGEVQVYGSDPDSVRFHLLMEASAEAEGKRHEVAMQVAAAAVPLSGRLLFLYALRQHREGENASAVRAALDRWVDATVAANRK